MYNLSYKGRKLIGKEIGINDSNSPLLLDNIKFNERVELLEPFIYIRNLIETYLDELKNFETEDEYIKFIEESENKLYERLATDLDIALKIEEVARKRWFKPSNILKTDVIKEDFVSSTMLELSLGEYKIYEAIKYKVIHKKMEDTQKEYLKNKCNCRYIIERNKLELSKFSNYHRVVLNIAMDEISSILSKCSSSVLNARQLLHVGNGEVVYSIQPEIYIGTINNVYKSLNIPILENLNVELTTYTLVKSSEKSDMLIKVVNNGVKKPFKYNQAELIDFMRKASNSEYKESDSIFEVNDTFCELSKHLNIDWGII